MGEIHSHVSLATGLYSVRKESLDCHKNDNNTT